MKDSGNFDPPPRVAVKEAYRGVFCTDCVDMHTCAREGCCMRAASIAELLIKSTFRTSEGDSFYGRKPKIGGHATPIVRRLR